MRSIIRFFVVLWLLAISAHASAAFPDLEMTGEVAGSGTTTSMSMLLQRNTDNSAGNTFTTSYSPQVTATFKLTALAETGAFNFQGTSGYVIGLMNRVGNPEASMFTASGGAASGTGLNMAANSAAMLTMDLPATHNLVGQPRNGKYKRAELTITFDSPVVNPILHLSGVGGNARVAVALDLLSSTPALASLKLLSQASNNVFNVTSSSITPAMTPGCTASNSGAGCTVCTGGAGCGSIQIVGNAITSVTFGLYAVGDATSTSNYTASRLVDYFSLGVSADPAPTLQLQAALAGAGRAVAADQFSLSATGTGAPAAVTTTGSATAVTSSALKFTATAGSAYTLGEAMASGSGSALAAYQQTVSCTNTGPTDVSAFTTLPVTVTPQGGDAISCTVTNEPRPATVKLQKITSGGFGGPFSFAQTNLASTPSALSTTAAGVATPTAPTAIAVSQLGTSVTLTETAVNPYALSSASCTDANGAVTGNTGNVATRVRNVVTIPAAKVKAGADFTCVLTNTYYLLNYWDGAETQGNGAVEGGQATWDATTTNWTSSVGDPNGIWASGGSAIFKGTAAIVTISGAQTIGGLQFLTGPYTLQGDKLVGVGAPTSLSANVANSVIASVLDGGDYEKTNFGTISLKAANTFTGVMTVKAGTLLLENDSALGSAASGTVVDDDGIVLPKPNSNLQMVGGIVVPEPLSIGGSGGSKGAVLISATGANTWSGPVTLIRDATVGTYVGGSLKFTGGIDTAGHVLTLRGGDSTVIDSAITGGGALVKTETGTATLNVAGSYGGSTTIKGGKLILGTTDGIPPASATSVVAVSATTSGTLDLNGKSQTLSAGLTVTGTLALNGGVLTLSGGSSAIAGDKVTGSGRIIVGTGATLTLTTALANTGVTIELAGGTLELGSLTHGIGRLDVSADSTLDFSAGGTAQLTTATLDMPGPGRLDVTNWVPGTDHFYATAFTGAARDATGAAPMNLISMAGHARSQTIWLTSGDEITVAPALTLRKVLGGTGRRSASDQFSLRASGTGAPAAVTTTGAGTAVASGVLSFVGSADASYTLDEVMAPGSVSPLARYVASVACTNPLGPTDVSAVTTTPIQLKPTYGDAIDCVLTNTSDGTPVSTSRIAGLVFRDTGGGGGVANDGLRNGGEAALSGIALRLTDCDATVHGTSTSDATGAFSFDAPALANGAAVCVEETNATGEVSTGASVDGTALPAGTATVVNGISYTYTRATTPDRIAFAWSGVAPTGLAFGDVPDNTFVAGGTRKVEPGLGLSHPYTHTFKAGTAGSVTFDIASATATPVISGWSERIYADKDCSGKLDAAAQVLYPPAGGGTAVTPGQDLCILVQETAPSAAQVGHRNEIRVRASFSYANAGPALSASYTLVDTTEVDHSALSLVKEVRNLTNGGPWGTTNQARSGDVLEYRVTYTNSSLLTMSAFAISDATPPYTTFQSATAGTPPAALGQCLKETPQNVPPAPKVDCAATQPTGGSGSIRWIFDGTLGPSATGVVSMTVKVQ